jgi:Tol biopolymer transport system component
MIIRNSFTLVVLALLSFNISPMFAQESFNPLRSEYMGQEATQNPEIFVPGKISTGYNEGCSLFYRGALSFLWRTNRIGEYSLLLLEDRKGRWQPPKEVRFFDDDSQVWDFTLAPSGDRIYFTSNKEVPGAKESNIWSIKLVGDDWRNPELLGKAVNTDWFDGYPSITKAGDLYFFRVDPNDHSDCRLYVAPADGKGSLRPAVRLSFPAKGPSRDYDPFVSADGTYLIFSSNRPEGFGEGDLYISFRKSSGEWGKAINLGPKVNSAQEDNRASITSDGRYFFFTSTRENTPKLPPGVPPARSMPGKGSRDIYWMTTDFIEELRKKSP